MRLLLSFCLFLSTHAILFAQRPDLHGSVVDHQNRAIPYATIRVKGSGKGVVANNQGEFQLKELTQNDTIQISCLAYTSLDTLVSEINLNEELIIRLEPENIQLNTVPVSEKGLENIVRKAIENVHQNFQIDPYKIDLFYRQYHIENDECVRLIEAAIDEYDPGYAKTSGAMQQERLRLKALRRSDVFEMNGATHGNHLEEMILENIAHYRLGTVLNEKALDYFVFTNPKGYSPSDSVRQILYFYENERDEKRRKGKIWIEKEDFRIWRIEEEFLSELQLRWKPAGR